MQTMEFDYTTGTLYWAAQTSTVQGPVQLDESFTATIDTLQQQECQGGAIPNEGQIVGLYIPFWHICSQYTRAAATDLKVVAGETGQPQATLEWVNPSKLFGGEPLLKSQRFQSIVMINWFQPLRVLVRNRHPLEIQDNFVGGNVIYRVVVSNANGNGAPPKYLLLLCLHPRGSPKYQAQEGIHQVTLTWDAPVASTNGGLL